MKHEKRYSWTIKTSRSADPIAIVSKSRRNIEENDVVEVRKIKASTCNLCTDHDSIFLFPKLKISISPIFLIEISMDFKNSSILDFILSHFAIRVLKLQIIE